MKICVCECRGLKTEGVITVVIGAVVRINNHIKYRTVRTAKKVIATERWS